MSGFLAAVRRYNNNKEEEDISIPQSGRIVSPSFGIFPSNTNDFVIQLQCPMTMIVVVFITCENGVYDTMYIKNVNAYVAASESVLVKYSEYTMAHRKNVCWDFEKDV